jgi:hypothetical protein
MNSAIIANGFLVADPKLPGQRFKVIHHEPTGFGFHSVDLVAVGGRHHGEFFYDITDTAVVFRAHNPILFRMIIENNG